MRYLGSKYRQAKRIAALVDQGRADGEPFWDLCCGGANVVSAVSGRGPRYAVDAVPSLVALLEGVRDGTYDPPDFVSEDEYASIRQRAIAGPTAADPLLAFVGFGCSFAGKWFGGYARAGSRVFSSESRRSLLRQAASLRGVEFICADWRTLVDQISGTVYIDPPYAGTVAHDRKVERLFTRGT